MRRGNWRGGWARRAQGGRVGRALRGQDGREARARALAARYQAFLGRSEPLAAAWRAFASASPATRAELELALLRAEDAVGGEALTQLREAAERELCRSYGRLARVPSALRGAHATMAPPTSNAADGRGDTKGAAS
jgi:hypothetical protein